MRLNKNTTNTGYGIGIKLIRRSAQNRDQSVLDPEIHKTKVPINQLIHFKIMRINATYVYKTPEVHYHTCSRQYHQPSR